MEDTDLGIVDSVNESGALSDNEPLESGAELEVGAEHSGETVGDADAAQARQGAGGQQQPVITGKVARDTINALIQAHPEHKDALKAMADSHFSVKAGYQKSFPTPRDAESAKMLIDALGGVDGATNLQARVAGYDQQEAGLESGDPAVLDSFFKDYPEGAAALAPHYLDKLAAANPQAFSATIAPYAVGMLQGAGIDQHLLALANETDPARLKAGVKQLSDWINTQGQNVAQLRQQGGVKAPGSDKLAQEREKLNTEREEIFRDGVSERVNSLATPVLNTEVDKLAKQYKLSDDQKKHLSETVSAKVISEMNADANYKKQVDLRYASKTRNREFVSDFIANEFNRRVREKAFDVAKSVYGAPKGGSQQGQGNGVVRAGTPKTAPGGGPIRVAVKPPDSELDTTRPDFTEKLFRLEAYTKAGRYITWRRA